MASIVRSGRPATWAILVLQLGAGFTPEILADRCIDERQRAAASSRAIEQEWSLRPADSLGDYFARIGNRLVSGSGAGGIDNYWRFIVVRNLTSNAFSIGDGYIYINEGALLRAASESEFAAVIAHEIGHQTAGHFCEPRRTEQSGPSPWNPFGGQRGDRATAAGGKKIGSIVQKVDVNKEMQADRQAVTLLENAGFDPHAILKVAKKFPKFDSASDARNRQRINALKITLYDTPRNPVDDSSEFRTYQKQLRDEVE